MNPFVGAGINYTTFSSVDETGLLAGTQLNLDSSWGLAVHAGLDFKINDKWLFSVNGRWKISTPTSASTAPGSAR